MWSLIGKIAGALAKPAGRFAGRWGGRIATAEVLDQTLTGGAVTNGAIATVQTVRAASDATGATSNFLKGMFNNVSDGMERNGVFALVPAAMALGFLGGDGIFGKLISTVLMGALAYVGANIADKNGIQLPTLSSLFKSATIPAPANETPAAALKAAPNQVLVPQP